MRNHLAAGLVLCLCSATAKPESLVAAPLPAVGVNLSPYAYWEPSFPFINVANIGGGWISTNGIQWSDDREIPLDSRGYPTALESGQIARSLIFTHNGAQYPTGTYRLRWQGNGDVRLVSGNDAQLIQQQAQERLYEVTDTSNLGLLLEIHETDPQDPVHGISVIPMEFENEPSRFHPRYVDDLQSYGVLRFMDWNATNNPTVGGNADWSQRNQLDNAHWDWYQGIPYEVQAELSNHMQQDLWLTVPHAANDDYVHHLAELIEQQLDPTLRVWVEFSNEAWNPQFAQYHYVTDELMPRYDTGRSEAYALRAAEIFDIFAEHLPQERMRRVVAGWAAVSDMLRYGLASITDDQGTNADVTAVTAYFSLDGEQMDQLYEDYLQGQVDRDRIFRELKADIDQSAQGSWKSNREAAAEFGLPLVAYEGGQHLTPRTEEQRNNTGFVELLASLQRDPRMGEMYDHLVQQWQSIGGSTIVFFNNLDSWDKYGTWGLRESFYEADSPKYSAVRRHADEFPGGYDEQTGRLRGDFNGDAQLDHYDIDQLSLAVRTGSTDPLYDLDANNELSNVDRQVWLRQLKRSALGDSNFDRRVDSADFVLVLQAGEYEDNVPQNSSWATGDWDGDGDFNAADLVAMMQEGNYEGDPVAMNVPEPSAFWLGVLAAALLAAELRRHRP